MTVENLIHFLRLSVNVSTPEGGIDSAYLVMTDEDMLLFLNVVKTRDFSEYPSLERLPESCVYPLVLLAKIELYYALAVATAPQIDLGADNNNYLKQDQRFQHYMSLIERADEEYKDYLENGGSSAQDGVGTNTLTSFDVLLGNRYTDKRSYDKGPIPQAMLYVDNVTETAIELSFKFRVRRFAWCNVYVSQNPVVDEYLPSVCKVVDKTEKVFKIENSRATSIRIDKLQPDTHYYIAFELVDMSSLIGYATVEVDTLPVIEEPEPDIPPIGGE